MPTSWASVAIIDLPQMRFQVRDLVLLNENNLSCYERAHWTIFSVHVSLLRSCPSGCCCCCFCKPLGNVIERPLIRKQKNAIDIGFDVIYSHKVAQNGCVSPFSDQAYFQVLPIVAIRNLSNWLLTRTPGRQPTPRRWLARTTHHCRCIGGFCWLSRLNGSELGLNHDVNKSW